MPLKRLSLFESLGPYRNKRSVTKQSSRRKNLFLSVLMIGSLVTSLVAPITQTTNVSAATVTADTNKDNPSWQIQSFLYYRAIAQCMNFSSLHDGQGDLIGANNTITPADATAGHWFFQNQGGDTVLIGQQAVTTAPIGTYMKDATSGDTLDVGSDGTINCDNTSLITSALKLWGLDAINVLCNSNFRRWDGGNSQSIGTCKQGPPTDFERSGSKSDSANAFMSYINTVVYGGAKNTPSLTDAQWYIFYRHTINESCITGIDTTAPSSGRQKSDNLYGYNDVKWVDTSKIAVGPPVVKSSIVTGSYIGSAENTTTVVTRPGPAPGYNTQQESCAQLAKDMSAKATAFQFWADSNIPAAIKLGKVASTTPESNKTSCVIEGIGWIVCGAMNAISGVVDGLYRFVSDILTLNPLQQKGTDGLPSAQYTTWQNIRNLANILLVIGFLVIIFSQLTSFGVSNYGIKKMLPRIIIVAIAINLSYFVMGLAIDITNILGTGIKTILDTTAADATLKDVSYAKITQAYLSGTTAALAFTGVAVVAAGAGALSASTLALLLLPFLLGAFLAVLAAFATMFIRNALIIVLVIISPVAFAAYLLPNTQPLFDRWRKLFISMLALFPLAALLFGGARLAAFITLNSQSDFSVIIALFIMAAPLGALPFLIKSSNSILSGINNKLQGAAKSARSATQRGLKPFVDKQKAQYRAGERNFLGQRQRPGSGRNLAQGFDQRRRSRALETQNSDTNAEENWKSAGVTGTGGAGRRAQRALDTQKTLGTRKSANEAQIEERSKRRIADDSTVDAGYERQSFDAQKGSSAAEALTKERNLGRVQSNFASTSAAAGGERLGNIERQRFGSEEASKTLELQMKRANMESGIAAGSVQAQKTAELGIKAVDAEEQATFDVSIPHNNDTIASTQQLDAATRASGTAAAELKKTLAEQAQMTPELAELDQRKRAAEDATSLVEKIEQAEYAENRDASLAYGTKLADDRASSAAATDLATYKETLTDIGVDSSNPLATEIQQARDVALQSRVAGSQGAAADRVAEQQYAKQLQSTPGLAQRVGGVDPEGESLVIAQAIETQRKARDNNVAAYGVRLRDQGVPDSPDAANPSAPSLIGISQDASRTSEEREAAGRAIVDGGNIESIQKYQDYLANTFGSSQTTLSSAQSSLLQAQQIGAPAEEISRLQGGVSQAQQGVGTVQALQKAYAEKIGSSPGKPMGLGAADIAAFRTGNYTRPKPSIQVVRTDEGTDALTVTALQTLNTVADRGVSMDNWAVMDKADIGIIDDLIGKGLIPDDKKTAMTKSLRDTLADSRWNGRIKDRERELLTKLVDNIVAPPTTP